MTRSLSNGPPLGRTRLSSLLLGAGLASLALGCGFEPTVGSLHFGLSETTTSVFTGLVEDGELSLEEARAAEAQILGALGMLCGTPDAPRFLRLDSWEDDERDSNFGVDELGDPEYDELVSDNKRRFKLQLELIEAQRYAEVPEPRAARELWRSWQAGLADLIEDPDALAYEGDDEGGTRHAEAIALFETHYPSLAESADLYRMECLHCHGTEGGGDGPTAGYLNPRPRDYRQGKFKWVAVERNTRPRREDLYRILHGGVTGTAMPSFARFSRAELEGLSDYVRLLAIRGEVEGLLTGDVASEGFLKPETVLDNYTLAWDRWDAAEDKYIATETEVPRPAEVTPEMLEHGRELFMGTVANCFSCHGPDGRGNGVSLLEDRPLLDENGEEVLDADGNVVIASQVRPDEWGNDSDPRNFQRSIFRGGARPIDFYRRIKQGISGTIMPAADPSLSDEDIFSIVYYVLSIAEDNDVARLLEEKLAHAEAEAHGDEEDTHQEGGH